MVISWFCVCNGVCFGGYVLVIGFFGVVSEFTVLVNFLGLTWFAAVVLPGVVLVDRDPAAVDDDSSQELTYVSSVPELLLSVVDLGPFSAVLVW